MQCKSKLGWSCEWAVYLHTNLLQLALCEALLAKKKDCKVLPIKSIFITTIVAASCFMMHLIAGI